MEDFYYLSSGAQNKMFTLRQSVVETGFQNGRPVPVRKSYFVKSLSTNRARAIEKGKAYAGDSKFLCDRERELDAITRRTAEELEAEENKVERANRAKQMDRDYWTICSLFDTSDGLYKSGYMPFGKHRYTRLSHLPVGYVRWMLFESTGDLTWTRAFILAELTRLHPTVQPLAPLPESNGEYTGAVKDRRDWNLTVLESFQFEGFYGWVNVLKMVDVEGFPVTYMGSKNMELKKGDEVKMKATIKKHEEYKGEKSTHISRPKILS